MASETLQVLRQIIADRNREEDKAEAKAWEMFRIDETREHQKKVTEDARSYQKTLTEWTDSKNALKQLLRDEAVLEAGWSKSGINLESLNDIVKSGNAETIIKDIGSIQGQNIESQIGELQTMIKNKEAELDTKRDFVSSDIASALAIVQGGTASIFPGGVGFGDDTKGLDIKDFTIQGYVAKHVDPTVANEMARYIESHSDSEVSAEQVLEDYYSAYDTSNVYEVGGEEISYSGDREGDLARKYGVDESELKQVASKTTQGITGTPEFTAIQDYFDNKAGVAEEIMMKRRGAQLDLERKTQLQKIGVWKMDKYQQYDVAAKADRAILNYGEHIMGSSENMGYDLWGSNQTLITNHLLGDTQMGTYTEEDLKRWQSEQINIEENIARTYLEIMGEEDYYSKLSNKKKAEERETIFADYKDMMNQARGIGEKYTGTRKKPSFGDYTDQWKKAFDRYETDMRREVLDDNDQLLLYNKMSSYFGIPKGVTIEEFDMRIRSDEDDILDDKYGSLFDTSDAPMESIFDDMKADDSDEDSWEEDMF
tara:strand:+ start:357 stop:1976 length:1620 start_codon:yes stop_codon:yes gene_type:complete